MKIKQKIISFALALMLCISVVSPINTVSAVNTVGDADNGDAVQTSVLSIQCSNGGNSLQNNCIWSLLVMAINILTAGVGLAAVGGIVYGGILYAADGGNSDLKKRGIVIIRNVVLGIVAYALMYSFLNFIVPGGMF